ncbi:MAG: hypothetical protein DMF89_00855, partial [Acidobacteria bacterium]
AAPTPPPKLTVDAIVKGAKQEKISSSKIYSKSGGFGQATNDFDALQGNEVQIKQPSSGGTLRMKELPDGSKAILRDVSSDGRPTLQVQPNTGAPIKIRYNP